MLYMVTFTINIPPMLAYIAYMDPMGICEYMDQTILMKAFFDPVRPEDRRSELSFAKSPDTALIQSSVGKLNVAQREVALLERDP